MSYLTINKKYRLNSETNFNDKLNELLTETDEFEINKLENNLIKIISNISWGVLIVKGGGGFPINILIDTSNVEINRTVEIRTKIRKEHFLLMGLLILFQVGAIFSNKDIWTQLFVITIVLISHFWLHFIYRVQENTLIKKVISKLELEQISI
ncbi:hypothetical protein [Reichenbachiella ulvae]|uniref:2TM domain-containing protein n=1 Tax=Reichenbachiella ulvae TaxID=2980104 RepID=A0ABT3CRK1_9BACT|nr:hypothetical protein [Reichenbachiella ulvae]MCV9386183.1 hypothetical protein [Reichenbachiella ulvae]